MPPDCAPPPRTALLLSGGGARAAYQVGVLQALATLRRASGLGGGLPFPILVGTSAGAINAAALAGRAEDFEAAVDRLAAIWSGFSTGQVYRADAFGVIRSGARWLTMLTLGWALARWHRGRPRSLLDNSPLAALLAERLELERLPALMDAGHLQALAVSASCYDGGTHLTFVQARDDLPPWARVQRRALPARIGVAHLLASSAIPFIFPATEVELAPGRRVWCGDGAIRQAAPLSPAVHLGAERILVIGAGRRATAAVEASALPADEAGPPSLAQVAGHALSSLFADALAVDVERLERINRTLALLPPEARPNTPLRPIELLEIAPSVPLESLALRHFGALPAPVRALLRGVGVGGSGPGARGAMLASYLLFEADYTCELMALGRADTLARAEAVGQFFGWPRPGDAPASVPEPARVAVRTVESAPISPWPAAHAGRPATPAAAG